MVLQGAAVSLPASLLVAEFVLHTTYYMLFSCNNTEIKIIQGEKSNRDYI